MMAFLMINPSISCLRNLLQQATGTTENQCLGSFFLGLCSATILYQQNPAVLELDHIIVNAE